MLATVVKTPKTVTAKNCPMTRDTICRWIPPQNAFETTTGSTILLPSKTGTVDRIVEEDEDKRSPISVVGSMCSLLFSLLLVLAGRYLLGWKELRLCVGISIDLGPIKLACDGLKEVAGENRNGVNASADNMVQPRKKITARPALACPTLLALAIFILVANVSDLDKEKPVNQVT